MRQDGRRAVFFGMLGVTLFGLCLPIFYMLSGNLAIVGTSDSLLPPAQRCQ